MKNIKKQLVFVVLWALTGSALADSYNDFFRAVRRDSESAVVALMLRGFDINTREASGDTGLMVALREGALTVASFLIAQPSLDPNLRNSADENALMIAAIKGHVPQFRALLARGAEVNKPGWAPLHYAAALAEPAARDLVQRLLQAHAYIDAASPNGTTPLMMAARQEHPTVARYLVEQGADPSLANQAGLTAADYFEARKDSANAAWMRERAAEFRRRYGTREAPVPAGSR